MKQITISFAAFQTYTPKNPERTAYRTQANSLDFDYTLKEWPSRAAMLKSIEMQSKREPKSTDWRDFMTIIEKREKK